MLIFTILVLIITILIIKIFSKSNGYPPGPINLPFIGSLYLIDMKHLETSFHNLYKSHGKLFALRFGQVYTVVFSEFEIIHQALAENQLTFNDRFILPSMKIVGQHRNMGMTNGTYWKTIRTLVTSALTKSKTRKQEFNINEQYFKFRDAIEKLINEKNNNHVPIRHYLKHLTFNVIYNFMFSKTVSYEPDNVPEKVKQFIKDSHELLNLLAAGSPGDYIKFLKIFDQTDSLKRVTKSIVDFTKPEIQQHADTLDKENLRDFIDYMIVEIQKDPKQQIEMEAIGNVCIDMLVGATDTSSTTIEWMILFLVNYPEIQEKLFSELNEKPGYPSLTEKNSYPLLNAIVKETFRISPPAPFGLPHQCNQDIVIDGKFIPKGSQIITNLYSAGRNENQFSEPLVFNPLRFINNTQGHIYPFSTGGRKCPGQPLAEDELFLVATKLFKDFKIERTTDELLREDGITAVTYDPFIFDIKMERRV